MTTCHALLVLLLSVVADAGEKVAPPSERLTEGKLAVSLGDAGKAETLFAGVADDPAASETQRAEALVRLGAVQRQLGKEAESAAAFERALKSPGRDAEVTRLLAFAVDGVAPDRRAWAETWPRLLLVVRASGVPGGGLSIRWPGPEPRGVHAAFPAREPVSFDLDEVPLVALLHHLLVTWRPEDKGCSTCNWPGPRTTPGFEAWPDYQPPAGVHRLNVVVHAAVQGFESEGIDDPRTPRVSVKTADMPWNDLFENVLASNGLGFVLRPGWLFVVRGRDQERPGGPKLARKFGGPPVTLNFLSGALVDVLRLFADVTGLRIVPDEGLKGSVTLRVSERPALEVLEMVLAANDLVATRLETPGGPSGPPALRIQRIADAKGEPVDLSRLLTGR